jgi:hypothetical protein
MSGSFDAGGASGLRGLAQLSILFAMASLLATARTLMLLPNAGTAGQWIVVGVGGTVTVLAFAFGVMISLHKPLARRAGFVVVAAALLASALFGLIADVVPESAWVFSAWTIVLLAYAALATHRLVRWPTVDIRDQPKSRLALFISYRRQDSQETVGRIYDHLRRVFEDKHIFRDVDRQEAGEDYRVAIGRALARADMLIAVIGTGWLTASDRDGRRRLDDPQDMVRLELEAAFERHLRVIPVLIEGATMPNAADLPPSLQPLSYRTALPVRPDPDFERDVQRLVVAMGAADAENLGSQGDSKGHAEHRM